MSAANAVEVIVIAISPKIRNRRRSRMSTNAPAGIANRNIGKLFATCTIETMNGSGSRLIMSQPEARLDIHAPTFETTVAVQMSANALWRNGAHADPAARAGEVAGRSTPTLGMPIPVNRAEN